MGRGKQEIFGRLAELVGGAQPRHEGRPEFSGPRPVYEISDRIRAVAFSKHLGLAVADMVKSSWVYKRLRNFRAGIEGTISFAKRIFGLDRCDWSGFPSFRAYVLGSVFACNLLILARHLLARSA